MDLLQHTLEQYYAAVYETDRDKAHAVVEEALQQGVTPEQIVFAVVMPAIERMVTELTVTLDSTLSQHFIASKVAEEVTEKMVALFEKAPECKGQIVIGCASGDFHGLGKKIVAGCLRAKMFEVFDLGLNVSPEKFVDEAVAAGASVIGVSSMMVHTAQGENGPKGVRRVLRERGLEDRIKLVVGGAPYRFDSELYKEVGADGWSENGIAAVNIIDELVRE